MLTVRWLWSSRSLPARATRLALIPPSLLYRTGMALRTTAYRLRFLRRGAAPTPVVAVGNLTVGGSGKTPISSWIARFYADRGFRPGIILRGYGGGDEGRLHRRLVEEAIVVESADRLAGAERAAANGADVVILDDAYQRLDIHRDLNVVLVSTESGRAARWTLPAGPWREGWRALKRADFVVVTRKRADRRSAEQMVHRVQRIARGRPTAIARLGVTAFRGLLSGDRVPVDRLAGAKIVAAAGVADPESFAGQCHELGAQVRLLPFADHQEFTEQDVDDMLHVGRRVDYVVVTEKDAVKLHALWPEHAREPLVASLDVVWEAGGAEIETALHAVVADIDDLLM